jgi:hypothetical protein
MNRLHRYRQRGGLTPCPTEPAANRTAIEENRDKLCQELSVITGLRLGEPCHHGRDPCRQELGHGYLYDLLRGHPELEEQFFNVARVCPQCQKPLGPSLKSCNGCGADQQGNDAISRDVASNLVSFLYRLSYGEKVYLRRGCYQLGLSHPRVSSKGEVLVYDDALALAYVHLNAIPFDTWCPDLTYLYRNPQLALVYLRLMYRECKRQAVKIINSHPSRRAKVGVEAPDSDPIEDVDDRFIFAGFNFPPSENQLHLQFMVAPMVPGQYERAIPGRIGEPVDHFTVNRFVFFEYLVKSLELARTDDSYRARMLGDLSGEGLKKPVKGQREAPANSCTKYFERYFFHMGNHDEMESYVFNTYTNAKGVERLGSPYGTQAAGGPPWFKRNHNHCKASYDVTNLKTFHELQLDWPTKKSLLEPSAGAFKTFPEQGKMGSRRPVKRAPKAVSLPSLAGGWRAFLAGLR